MRRESESQERAQKHLEKVQKDQLRERRLANKEEWDNLTPIAYMNKCKIDLKNSDSVVRAKVVSKLNPKNFAREYYEQFPPYYLLEVLIKQGHKFADDVFIDEWVSDFNVAENEGKAQDSLNVLGKITNEATLGSLDYRHNTRTNLIQDALKEVEWKMHTIVLSSNDSIKTRKDVDNLLKFLRSENPALHQIGLGMAKKSGLEIFIDENDKVSIDGIEFDLLERDGLIDEDAKSQEELESLIKFLRSDDPSLRLMGFSMAEKTNFEIGIEDLELELIEIIAEKLRDKNRRVRTAAALQLGAHGDGRARYELEQALLTVDRDVLKDNYGLTLARNADRLYEAVLRKTELINDYLEKLDEEEWDE